MPKPNKKANYTFIMGGFGIWNPFPYYHFSLMCDVCTVPLCFLMHQCTIATKTYRVVFNMKDYGAPTKKPTMLLTNSASICKLHNAQVAPDGKSRKPKSKKRPGCSARVKAKMRKGGSLCRRYVDRAGRQRFAGTKRLKESQILGLDSLIKGTSIGTTICHYRVSCQSIVLEPSFGGPLLLTPTHHRFLK